MMKKIFLAFAFLLSVGVTAQEINNYKYVILPEKFEFQKEPNQYNISNLTKMLLEKYGFVVYFPNQQYPEDLALNRCKALYGDVVKQSSILNTSLAVELKDCQGKVVYRTEEGKSREKEWKKAYYEALRAAGNSFDVLNYHYTGDDLVTVTKPVTRTEVVDVYVASNPAQPSAGNTINLLTAKKLANGYELLDKSGSSVLKMFKTSQQDYYTAQMETRNGVVFKKDGQWYFEYYDNDKLISQKLNIQF